MQYESEHRTNVGATLKRFRLKHKLTLRKLASRVDLSPSFLSRVEKGSVQPSIETLGRLARFFGCPIEFFFAEENDRPEYRIIRDGDRHIVHSHDRSIDLEFLTDCLYGNPRMEVAILTMKPKAAFGSAHTHLGEEVIHVMKGEAGIKLGEREIVLRPGETVTLDPRLEHNVRNVGESEAKLLVAIAPPNPRLP